MADEAPDKQPPEGSNIPPLNINVVNTSHAKGSGGSCGSSTGTSTASLSSAGLPLPVQLDRGRVVNAYSYLPPQSVHLQGVAGDTEQQQIPSSVGPYPPIRVWGTTSHPPVPYYGPVTYPYRNVSGPMEYRHPHLQPVPNIQLLHMQPPGQRHIQPASVQDGRGLCFYNHAVLTPIPVRQTSPFVQTGRAVPVPSAPTNKVVLLVKKAEPQRNVTIRTNMAHRQEHRPIVVYHIPETSADQEECQSNASQLTDPLAVQRSLETTSSSMDQLNSENVNVLSTQPGTQEAHQPPLIQPEDQETAKGDSSLVDFTDEFQLPQDLLNTEQFPDIEKLIASIEPLLPECLFPPINSKEATQDSSFQKMSLEQATGVKNIRCETQGKSTREMQTVREANVCPVRTSLLPVTRNSVSEGVVPIIDLCGSEDEEPRIFKSNISHRDQTLEEPPSKLPAVSFTGKGSFPQRQNTVLPPIPFVPRGHNLEGENNSISGQGVYELGGTTFGDASIPGPIYIVEDGACPTPQTLVAPKDNTKLKYLKKTMKTHSDTLETGECNPSPKVTSDLQLPKGKRKNLTEGEPLRKISGKLPGLDMPRPKGSTSGSEKVQSTQQHLAKDSEQHLAKRSHEEKSKSPNQEPPVKEKMKIFIPGAEPLDKKRKRNLDRELSGSHSRDLQTGLNNSETLKNTSKEQRKDKAKANNNPTGTKGKKKGAKVEAETVKQIPRSNLALHMMESVQVFYPLGKSNVSTVPSKKIPSVTTSHTISEKTSTTLPRPLPRPLLRPLPKPLPNILSRQQSTILPKPPSKEQSSSLPKPVTSLSKPMLRQWPKPPDSGPDLQATQVFSRWRVPPNTPISGFHSSALPNDFPSNTGRSSSPVQEFNGATFIPWRTPPDDLEVSSPITEEQRPIREMMKQQAQREREEAACWTSVGRVKFFVEREKEMDISIQFGYPWRR